MEKLDLDVFSMRLRTLREQCGLSYQALANLTGINKSTLQRYENGSIRNVPIGKLQILSDALQVTPAELIGMEDSANISEFIVSDQNFFNIGVTRQQFAYAIDQFERVVSGKQESLNLNNVPVSERQGIEQAYLLLTDLKKLSSDERKMVRKYYTDSAEEEKAEKSELLAQLNRELQGLSLKALKEVRTFLKCYLQMRAENEGE